MDNLQIKQMAPLVKAKVKEFKAVLPLPEVEDTLGDLLVVSNTFEKALTDGFQLFQDILQIAGTEDEIRDIISSFADFIEEFKKVNPEVAKTALDNAVARATRETGEFGRITNFVENVLRNSVSSYAFALKVKNLGESLLQEGKQELANWSGLFNDQEAAA